MKPQQARSGKKRRTHEVTLQMDQAKRRIILNKAQRGVPQAYGQIAAEVEVARSTVYRVVERVAIERASSSGIGDTRRTARTPELVMQVQESVEANPRQSIRKLARESNISERSMRRLIKKDLGARSLSRSRQPALTHASRQRRLERAQGLLNRLKNLFGCLKNLD